MIGGSSDGGMLMARRRQWWGWEGADSGGARRGPANGRGQDRSAMVGNNMGGAGKQSCSAKKVVKSWYSHMREITYSDLSVI